MSNARQGWNAAQLASERPLPGRKSHAPVGTPVVIDWGGGTVDVVHKCCGYHVCSCPAEAAWYAPTPALLTYDQAVAACREGKRVVSTLHPDVYSFDGQHFLFNDRPAIHFGQIDALGLPRMQFAVLS